VARLRWTYRVSAAKRILVIDDSPFVVEAVSDALSHDRVVVEGLEDVGGLHAETPFETFDLILMDVQMPAMFGDDAAVAMRERAGVVAPIVLLSSLPEAELAERASSAGVDGYILKQRGVDSVVEEVRAWLDGRRSRRAKGS
jgi:two-component system response regulator DesR